MEGVICMMEWGSAVICKISGRPLGFCSRRFKEICAEGKGRKMENVRRMMEFYIYLCVLLCLFFVISVVKKAFI